MLGTIARGIIKRTVGSKANDLGISIEKRIDQKLEKALEIGISRGIKKAKSELISFTLNVTGIALIFLGALLILSKYFQLEYFLILAGLLLLFVNFIRE